MTTKKLLFSVTTLGNLKDQIIHARTHTRMQTLRATKSIECPVGTRLHRVSVQKPNFLMRFTHALFGFFHIKEHYNMPFSSTHLLYCPC